MLLCVAASLLSCAKESEEPKNTGPVNLSMEEISPSDEFNWSTYQEVELNLSSDTDVIVKLLDQNGGVREKFFLRRGEEKQRKLKVDGTSSPLFLEMGNQRMSIQADQGVFTHHDQQ